MVYMRSWVDIEGGKVRRNVLCVGMSVNVTHVLWVELFL